jgi:hypothetical protein
MKDSRGTNRAISILRSYRRTASPALSQGSHSFGVRSWLRVIDRIDEDSRRPYRQSKPTQGYNLGVSPTTISSWLQVSQGLLTPVIALTTIYIAWQQLRLNKQKFKADTYERKLRIYQSVVEMRRLVMKDGKPEVQDILKFGADTAEADFLFPGEISKYINEIYTHAVNLHAAVAQIRTDSPNFRDEAIREELWFQEQYDVAKEKFRKYLNISR